MDRVSVVINVVKEEVEFLPAVLASVKDFAFETVLVDMSGLPEVAQIAKKYKAKLFAHKFVNYVEPARNFGIEKAQGEWILILDPDEELSAELTAELGQIVKQDKADYVRIARKNLVFGKWLEHSRWWPDYNIRFFKKGFVNWSNEIHSIPITEGRVLEIEPKEELAIIHHHYSSVDQYIVRLNRYTLVQATKKRADGYVFDWKDLIIKPTGEFVSRFFAGQGYKDGLHGLALSVLQAFSEFILYLKVWELEKFEDKALNLKNVIEQMNMAGKDVKYWQADALVNNGGGILQRVKRKFKV